MDNRGHYFCLQSFALTHRLSLFIHTDLSESRKPVSFPASFSLWQTRCFPVFRFSWLMALWGFPDCALNCILNRVDKHEIIYKKEDWPCCQNTHTLPSKFTPWSLASWEQDTCKIQAPSPLPGAVSLHRTGWGGGSASSWSRFAHSALKLSHPNSYLQAHHASFSLSRAALENGSD